MLSHGVVSQDNELFIQGQGSENVVCKSQPIAGSIVVKHFILSLKAKK